MNNKTNNNFSLRKFVLTALVAGPLATLPAPLWALPSTLSTNLTTSTGVTVSTVSGNTINVTAPDKAVLSWGGFGNTAQPFNAGETLNFFQPTVSSSVLNLVTGGYYSSSTSTTDNANYGSVLNGTIAANGNVFFLNPNGITIGSTGVVNVGGFIASTSADPLAANSFALNGNLTFAGPSIEKVIVSPGAAIQAVGTGLNIRLVGKGVDINGGSLYGNVNVVTNGGNATLGGIGQVVVDRVNNTGGNLTITTAGGNAKLTGGNSLLVGGSPTTTLSSNGAGAAPIIIPTIGANNTVAAGKITGYTIVNGGTGYTAAPTVTFTDANGASVQAATTITGGVISTIAVPAYASPIASQTAGTAFLNPNAGTNGVNITGNLSVNTTGTTNGSISSGSSMLIANTSGTVATFNTGTGTTAGNISIGSASFANTTITANNATIVAPATGTGSVTAGSFVVGGQYVISAGGNTNFQAIGAANNNAGTVFTATGSGTGNGTANNSGAPSSSDIALNASVLAGSLGIWNNNSQIAAGTGTTSVAGTISLSQASNQLSFNGTGALTFALLQAASTVNITSNGDITLPYASSTAPSFGISNFTAGSFNVGGTYVIASAGNTNFTAVGAANNNVGTSFVATGTGSGNGTAYISGPTLSSVIPAPTGGTTPNFGAPIINSSGVITGFTYPTTIATALNAGSTYTISAPGNTNFVLIGAANNNAGTVFTATGAGAAGTTGTVTTPGSGYTAAPLVTITSSINTQAPIVLPTTLTNGVPTVNLSSAPTFPTVVTTGQTAIGFTAAPTGGTTATVSPLNISTNSSGQITGITVLTAGSGYTAAPTLTVTNNLGQVQTFATTINSTGGVTSVIVPVNSSQTSIGTQANAALARQLSVTSTGGKITGGFITQGSTLTLLAAGDITLTGLTANTGNSGALSITSTGGKITLGSFATNGGGTLRAPGDIVIGGLATGLQGNISHTNTGLTITSTGGTVSAGQITSSTTSGFSIVAASDITLPISSVQAFSVTSTAGRILQAANTYITQNGTSTNNLVTLNAASDITLANSIINVDATAGGFTVGRVYTIASVGTTDFTLIGAANNNVGTTFIASGTGVGTGRATIATGNDFNRIVLQNGNGANGINIVGTSYASNTAANAAGLNPKAIIIAN